MKQRIVTGPVVVLPDSTTGKTAYYYQGAILPAGLDEARVAGVIADGLVTEQDVDAAPADEGIAAEVVADDQVPDGTADDVLAWVGTDRDRATLALNAERAGKNRSTLIGQLTKLSEPAS